MDKVLNNTGNY